MIKRNETISIEVLEIAENIISLIKELPHVYEVTYEEKMLKVLYSGGKHNLIRILDLLKNEGVSFGRVYSERPTLNDVFLEITGKELRD